MEAAKSLIGWGLFVGMLLWHLLSNEIARKLDWVNFGTQYRTQQEQLVRDLQKKFEITDTNTKQIVDRLELIEKSIPKK